MKKITLFFVAALMANVLYCQEKTWPLEETVIGYTDYDLQTWRTMQNRIYYYEDGTIGAVWNMGFNYPQFPDMGIGYNYFDGNMWGNYPYQSITSVWAINPSYTAWGENGEMVISQGGNGLVISTREEKGTGDWQEGYFSGSGYKHPVVVTSGVDHSIIQLLYLDPDDSFTGTPAQPVRGFIHYSRSTDGGQTWSPANFILDGLGPDEYLGFTIGSYSWSEPKGDVIAFVAGDYLTDLVLMKSTDGGDSWQKTIIWEHPFPFFEIFTFNSDTFYCNDGAITVALDNNNMAHVAFGLSRVYSTTSQDTIWYCPLTDGIVYWREDMPGFKNTVNSLHPDSLSICGNLIGWTQDINGNGQLDFLDTIITYPTLGVSTMPSLVIDDWDQVILTFCSTTEGFPGTYNYKHLFARLSPNLNCDWGDFYCLTASMIHIFDECIYPNVAPNVDDAFHLIYSTDNTPGLAVLGDHPYSENKIWYMEVNLNENKSSKESLYVDFKINQDSIFEGDTVYFQNLSCGCPYPYTFEWEFEGGSPLNSTDINPFIVYNQAGIYDVQLTAFNGSSTATELKPDYITVLPATKVDENMIFGEVEIFPNPSTGSLTINLQNQNGCNIKVIDLLGNTIYDQNYIQHNRKINLDLSDNPEGMYFIEVKSGDQYLIKKIVLRK